MKVNTGVCVPAMNKTSSYALRFFYIFVLLLHLIRFVTTLSYAEVAPLSTMDISVRRSVLRRLFDLIALLHLHLHLIQVG